jgi:type VI secretion system secreted protein VgrG
MGATTRPRGRGADLRSVARGAVAAGLLVAAWLLPTTTARAAVAPTVGLGTAAQFSILAGTTVTNTGPTAVEHDLGVSPGSAVVGFPPGTVTPPAVIHTDAVSLQAQNDLTTAYNDAATRPASALTGAELGGLTLQGGVYAATAAPAAALEITGTLTLDGAGDPRSVWIFQTGSTLTTGSDSAISLVNGASACNVFWQVGSSATLGTRTKFLGSLMALTSITLQDSVVFGGRALARNGAVTLINDTFSGPDCSPVGATTTSSGPTMSTGPAGSTSTSAPGSSTTTTTNGSDTTTTTQGVVTTVSGATSSTSGHGPTSTSPGTDGRAGRDGAVAPTPGGPGDRVPGASSNSRAGGNVRATGEPVAIARTGGDLRDLIVAAAVALGLGSILQVRRRPSTAASGGSPCRR